MNDGGLSPAQRELEIERIVTRIAWECAHIENDALSEAECVMLLARPYIAAGMKEIRLILERDQLMQGYANAKRKEFAKRAAVKKAKAR
jgi:hypothetical protein